MRPTKLIHQIIINAVRKAISKGDLPLIDIPQFSVFPSRNPEHGDFSTNIAFVIASQLKQPPLKIATAIVQNIDLSNIEHTTIT